MSESVTSILNQLSILRHEMEKAKLTDRLALSKQEGALVREMALLEWDDDDQQNVSRYEKGEFIGERPSRHKIKRK